MRNNKHQNTKLQKLAQSLLFLLISSAIYAQVMPEDVKEPTFLTYGFDGIGREIKQNFGKNNYRGVFEVYNHNIKALNKKQNKYDYWYYISSRKYNEECNTKMRFIAEYLDRVRNCSEFNNADWKKAAESLRDLDEILAEYDTYSLLCDPKYRLDKIDNYINCSRNIKQYFEEKRKECFHEYIKSEYQKPFHEIYPLISDAKLYYKDNLENLESCCANNDTETMLKFLNIHSKYLENVDMNKLMDLIFEHCGQNGKLNDFLCKCWNCNIDINVISDFINSHNDIIIITPSNKLDFNIQVVNAISRNSNVNNEKQTFQGKPTKRILIIQPFETILERKILEKRDLASKYISGYIMESNQNHFNAQLEYNRARDQYYSIKQQADNYRPAGIYDFGGIALGIQAGEAGRAMNQALSLLESTPMQVSVPQYQEYQYGVTKLELIKTCKYYTYYYENNWFYKAEHCNPISQKFEIAYNINSKDPDSQYLLSKYHKEIDLDTKEKEDMIIDIKNILLSLNNNNRLSSIERVFDEINNNDRKIESNVSNKAVVNKSIDNRMQSIVIVSNPSGGMGSGFFVGNDMIITNYHVVEGSSFAEIKNFNGDTAIGKVVKVNPGLDLALIKVRLVGTQVDFTDEIPDSGTSVDAIGHPKGLFFSLTRGIISAVRYIPNPLIPGSSKMMVLQIDAAINPGNSGGPLYIDNKVIGINSQKLSAKGIEGLGFALHSSEIIKFIKNN